MKIKTYPLVVLKTETGLCGSTVHTLIHAETGAIVTITQWPDDTLQVASGGMWTLFDSDLEAALDYAASIAQA